MLPTTTNNKNLGSGLTNKRWLSCLSICGCLSAVFLIIGLAASRNIPPTRPWWDAETVKTHYLTYHKGTQAASIFLFVSGALFLPYSTAITSQIRLIPDLNPAIADLQLASATAGVWFWMISAIFMSLLSFRDYSAELIQFLNDAMWMSLLLNWPIFWVQFWTIAWAIFADRSADPVFPKIMGWVNLVAPVVLALGSGVHMHHTGPFAWNGGLVFWPTLVVFGVEMNCSCWFILQNVRRNRY
ncbi:uncharacterized protein N7511_003774 [Penicillium nucicola]|uniref:uncharacterized protein n=1 Tax=Penicillium nucicola TaxID=1850975 RepID=UPI00254512A2|nr:uncharacterized protein N7511_003774 [Penicillium nucicola]KAJ5766158.1 hypothetical protein N7511_003774 [Penicillium nucicola]